MRNTGLSAVHAWSESVIEGSLPANPSLLGPAAIEQEETTEVSETLGPLKAAVLMPGPTCQLGGPTVIKVLDPACKGRVCNSKVVPVPGQNGR